MALAGGGEQVDGESSRSVTRLKLEISAAEPSPRDCPDTDLADIDLGDFFEEVLPDVLDELAEEEREPEFDGEEQQDADAAAAASHLLRLGSDRALYDLLAAQGFTGARYEMFRAELAAYALPIMRAWLRRGLIFAYCKQKGRPVAASEIDRRDLAQVVDERIGLANETVAAALNMFHDKALVGGGWSAKGGASLTTYFVGACVGEFPGIFRKWRTARRNWRTAMGIDGEGRVVDHALHPSIGEDPADQVTSREAVLAMLRRMPDKVEEVASRMVWEGKTHAEIATELGTTPEAIGARLYRHRTEFRRRQDERRQP
jgi:DNA-directed RNA polymerase specialized sigma24 family protein